VYQLDLATLRGALAARTRTVARPVIDKTVWLLGIVSALTDVSSEMVSSILPAYLFVHLQLSPIQFGLIDGLYQGVAAIARLLSGVAADRSRRYKLVAAIGYGLSAISKLGLLAAGAAWGPLAAAISADRLGKGIRTAPRDALISLATARAHLATSFGVHRALDTTGAVIGPMIAFALLRSAPGRFDAVFVASFSIAIVGFAVLLLLVDERPASLGEPAPLPPIRAKVWSLCSDARFGTITIAAALASFVVVSDAFLYLLLQWRAGVAIETIPLLYVGTATAYLALAAPFGRWADRMGRVPMFVAGHVCILAVYTVVAWFGINTTGLVLCLALHGAYYAATDGVLAALVSAETREGLRASSLSALATATSAARLGGSFAVGLLWAWRGPQAVAVAGVIVLTMSIVCIAIALGRTAPDAVQTGVV
jgi:MFS family permease